MYTQQIKTVRNEWPLLISENEAARLLGISDRSLFKLRQAGQVPFVRLGGRVLYNPTRLREIAEQRTAPELATA
jgi:excisionase family DNA binding protein